MTDHRFLHVECGWDAEEQETHTVYSFETKEELNSWLKKHIENCAENEVSTLLDRNSIKIDGRRFDLKLKKVVVEYELERA